MVYAQAEDDFNRIEMNYLTSLGRLSEAEGEKTLMQDLRARLYIEPADLQRRFAQSPIWLQALMAAWADGLNFYLATHPQTHPKVLTHFEPWMALSFTEGSIGGDIEDIALPALAHFYGWKKSASLSRPDGDPTGSNGIAIAPQNTIDHHALLLINPHTSFYFRSELQMTSDEGLDAYGAATWGQFFLYQGFNTRLGWMHTSSHSDAIDQFAETIVHKDNQIFYRYGDALRSVETKQITLAYRNASGGLSERSFTTYRTHHGPVVAATPDGHWIAEAMMFNPVPALEQSYSLTKAHDYAAYMKVMELKANTSNNTIYADADGHIAYLHPQFIPRRDDRFDYTKPIDGADLHTDWQGLHALTEAPHLLDPSTGWIENTNNWPYTAAGAASPKQSDYPRYMDTVGDNMRGLHAVALLTNKHDFTLPGLVAAAYDSAQPGFDILIPHLLETYDHLPAESPFRKSLADQIAVLRSWDRRWSAESVATTLAVYWGEFLWNMTGLHAHASTTANYKTILDCATPRAILNALTHASTLLTAEFGTWRQPWGSINRVQRLTDDLDPVFSDSAPSLPVPFTSAQWGSLASITGPTTNQAKRYGNSGNSFVAAVEFGPSIKAVAVTAGGESGDPASKHFNDEAARYASGHLRDVYFYPEDLERHMERRYHPGGADFR